MRIFLTGAGGFLGAAIAAEMARQGDAVTCLLRPGSDPWRLELCRDRVAVVEADLDDPESLARLLAEAEPEAVCHAAWRGVLGRDRDDPIQDANITATTILARLTAEAGAAFLGIGSQAEYGPLNRMAGEDEPPAPTTRYGAAKVAACREAASLCAQHGRRFAWLRVFSLYGPRDHDSWLLPYVVQTLLQGARPALTAAEQHWDFLHVADAARAVRCVLSSGAAGFFNLGSGTAPPLRHTIEQVRDLIDPALPLGFGEVAYRPDQVMWLQADIARLRSLGWRAEISLAEGLRETISWFRSG